MTAVIHQRGIGLAAFVINPRSNWRSASPAMIQPATAQAPAARIAVMRFSQSETRGRQRLGHDVDGDMGVPSRDVRQGAEDQHRQRILHRFAGPCGRRTKAVAHDDLEHIELTAKPSAAPASTKSQREVAS